MTITIMTVFDGDPSGPLENPKGNGENDRAWPRRNVPTPSQHYNNPEDKEQDQGCG
ncbi:hypothetical protein [Nonomuraea sp. NPDC049480]|uniref:hypothetical protein n=1 Tax=Nonomuraea sp. NPDC049480 TaxID=3364353 RepID=UPI0037A1FCFA